MGIISLHTITHKKRSNMTEVFWHHCNPQYYYQKFLLAIIFPNIETYISFGHWAELLSPYNSKLIIQ